MVVEKLTSSEQSGEEKWLAAKSRNKIFRGMI
jgi:hypothetical protein